MEQIHHIVIVENHMKYGVPLHYITKQIKYYD